MNFLERNFSVILATCTTFIFVVMLSSILLSILDTSFNQLLYAKSASIIKGEIACTNTETGHKICAFEYRVDKEFIKTRLELQSLLQSVNCTNVDNEQYVTKARGEILVIIGVCTPETSTGLTEEEKKFEPFDRSPHKDLFK